MNGPPGTTIIFSDFPEGALVGLDLDFIYKHDVVKGLKNISSGIHVFHFAPDQSSYRSGFYINAVDHSIIVIRFDKEGEKLLINDEIEGVEKEIQKLPEIYQFMVPHESTKTWSILSSHIKYLDLERILPKNQRVDSLLTSTEENNKLLEALQKSANNRGTSTSNLSKDPIINSIIDQSDEEIKYTVIDLTKTVRPNSDASQKTLDSLDKSWFLENLLITRYNNNEDLIIGEFQLSYLNTVIFANHCSVIQWLKILKVLFNTKNLVLTREALFIKLIEILLVQLRTMPDEYTDEFIEQEFWITNVSNFDYNIKELGLHKLVRKIVDLKNLLMSKFEIDVDDYVEDDEYEPVVV